MDERTKELGSQLNSAADDETETTEEDDSKEEKIENPEEEEYKEKTEEKDQKENKEDEGKEDTSDNKKKEEGEADEEDTDKNKKQEKTKEPSKTEKQDRWHGKSREEVIKSYEELEKQAQDSKEKKSESASDTEKPQDQKQKKAGEELEIPTDEELAKMTPKGFAEWMINTVGKMVEKTYDTRGKVKEAVSAEIREAQKEHPLLKTNQEYREMILALVDAAAQKGTVMPLKDACAKVDTMIGRVKGDDNKITDEDKARLKKAKAQVERGAGAPASTGEEKGAEQKRLENIFGTGRSKSPFGGLGV